MHLLPHYPRSNTLAMLLYPQRLTAMFVNGCLPLCFVGILVSEEFRAENINKNQWNHKGVAMKYVKKLRK